MNPPNIGGTIVESVTGRDAHYLDRRRDERHKLTETKGRLLYKWESIRCDFIDISVSGCRVRTEEYFDAGALANVDIILPLCGIQVRLSGITQWVSRSGLIGIRFIHHSHRTQNELAGLLSGLVDKNAADVLKEAASSSPYIQSKGLLLSQGMVLSPQVSKEAPQEDAELVSANPSVDDEWQEAYRLRAEQDRLEALALQTEQERATNAPETETGPDLTKSLISLNFNPITLVDASERRVQNLGGEEWSATVRFLADDRQVSGTLLHVSQTGCVFRTSEDYPGMPACHVEIEFQLRGLPFRIAGINTAVRGVHTVEIGFLEMSTHKKEELAQALGELPRDEQHLNSGELIKPAVTLHESREA